MRRFKSRLFKKEKRSKVKTQMRRSRRKNRKVRISKEELDEWELNQIQLAIKEYRHRRKKKLIFVEHPILVQTIPERYTIPKSPTQADLQKIFTLDHLLDSDGILTYWGKYPKEQRPKPRLVNGHRSPEDIIFNPDNTPANVRNTKRQVAFETKRVSLFRRLGFDESRSIVGDPIPDLTDKQIKKLQKGNVWKSSAHDLSILGNALSNNKVDTKKEIKSYIVIQLNGEIYETNSRDKAISKAKHNAIIRYSTPGQHIICIKYIVKIKHGKKTMTEIGKLESSIY